MPTKIKITHGGTGTLPDVLTGPIVMTGAHEPLSFRRRTGGAAANEAETWEREHAPETIAALARRGVTWLRAHFYKGYGLAAERPEIEMTARVIRLCHEHGMRVELYTQFGSLHYETFLDEEPKMTDWCCVTEDGRFATIRYGHQDFRYRPCLVRDGYWRYLRKVLRLGIELGGDAFGFDNVESPMEPKSCHCPQCRAAFVRFLKARYRPDTPAGRKRAAERFGFPNLDHIRPPTFNEYNLPTEYRRIASPVFQEWIEFRCENMRRRFEEIWRFAKGLKPEVALEYNVYPPAGKHAPYWQGIDMSRLGPWMDLFYNERSPWVPKALPDGTFHHRTHALKLAQAMGNAVVSGNEGDDDEQRRLSVCEMLAFNQGHIGRIGRLLAVADGAGRWADEGMAFRHRFAELYEGSRSAAELGLVESARTLAVHDGEPYLARILAMNTLLNTRRPWDMVLRLDSSLPARIRVLALPDVECMSDEEAAAVMAFVRDGGAVVATGETGVYDAWFRRRPVNALAGMLGRAEQAVDAVVAASRAAVGRTVSVCEGTFGKGRFVWLARLTPAIEPAPPSRTARIGHDEATVGQNLWRLPLNAKAFSAAVAKVGRGRLGVEVDGDDGLAAELRRAADGRTLLHLVNYRLDRPARRVAVRVNGPVGAVRLYEPGVVRPRALTARRAAGRSVLSVGTVRRYAVLAMERPGSDDESDV